MTNPRVLVSGAPGWLGTGAVQAIVGGFRAGPVDQPSESVRVLAQPGSDSSAIDALPGVHIVEADVTKPLPDDLCAGIDTIFHSAGLVHPKRIRDLYRVNVDGTRHVLERAIAGKARRFVYVSSNSPAGLNESASRLMLESDSPRPYLNYGKSKFEAERLVREAHDAGRIEAVILRPCWFYGPNQPLRQTTFFKMIKGGHPIVVGKGTNLRSMSYVDNIVQGLFLARSVPAAAGQTYWIADERPYPFMEVLETVAELLGVTIEPRYLPKFAGDCARWVDSAMQSIGLYKQEIHVAGELGESIAVSIDKAKKELGYAPTIELKEGMRRSIEWCRAQGVDI